MCAKLCITPAPFLCHGAVFSGKSHTEKAGLPQVLIGLFMETLFNGPLPRVCYVDVFTQIRWVDVSDMGGLGITTGMKKVVALASKARSSSNSNSTSKPGPPFVKKNSKRISETETKTIKDRESNRDTKRDRAKLFTRARALPARSVKTSAAIDGRKRPSDGCDESGKEKISNARSRSKRTKGGGGKVGR